MEPNAQLPELLAALMFGAMLAAYSQIIALRRKSRDDRHKYEQRMRRNHAEPRNEHRTPPQA